MDILMGPDELTAEWMTAALRSSGTIKDAVVTSVEFARVLDEHGRHVGAVGFSGIVNLRYDLEETDMPSSAYIKLSSPDEKANRIGLYEREVGFYQKLASRSGLRTPRCYYSDVNTETGDHILVLEHMVSVKLVELFAGYSPEDAELAIRSIALFHVAWWESPEIETIDWLDEWPYEQPADVFQEVWDLFVEQVERPLPAMLKALGPRCGEYIVKMYKHCGRAPQTLLHGDYHTDNMLFPADDPPLAVVDWQLIMRGRGAMDVAHHLLLSLQTPDRRASEVRLLRLYHDTLLEQGVQGYTFEECFQDYRIAMFRPLSIFVVVVGNKLLPHEHLIRFVESYLPRLDAVFQDHQPAKLLDGL